MIRVDPANPASHELRPRLEWTKSVAVGHVQLCATAELAGKFVEHRLEKHLTKMCARSLRPFSSLTEFSGSIHGAPKISNGRVVPRPSETFVPFEQAHSGINRSGNECRHIGRRHYPAADQFDRTTSRAPNFFIGRTVSAHLEKISSRNCIASSPMVLP